jgi:TatA/E family protein of Tat protein translocase
MPLHWSYLIILLVIVLIIFGPGKLPEMGSAVGKAINEFRRSSNDLKEEFTRQPAAKADHHPEPGPSEDKGKSAGEPTKS